MVLGVKLPRADKCPKPLEPPPSGAVAWNVIGRLPRAREGEDGAADIEAVVATTTEVGANTGVPVVLRTTLALLVGSWKWKRISSCLP